MIFKGNPDKVPCSDFILDEQLETDTGQITRLNMINPGSLCKFVGFDCVMKSVANRDVKICYRKSDIDPNKISDVSFLMYQFKSFKAFLKFVHRIKSPVIVDCAKILGLPRVEVIFGLNFKVSMANLSLNPSDMLVMNELFNSHFINRHIRVIVKSFHNFVKFFGDNVIEAQCPVIFLKVTPMTLKFGSETNGRVCFVVHCKK